MPLTNNAYLRAIRISTAGDVKTILLDRSALLQAIYTAIGCRYVEVVQPTDTICLWVDEEGLLNQSDPNLLNHSDPNLLATLVAAELGSFPQVLRGTVVTTGGADCEGDTMPLSEERPAPPGGDRRPHQWDWTEGQNPTPTVKTADARKHDLGS